MASSLRGTTNENLSDAVNNVALATKEAYRYGLVAEVIATAMVYMKENPDKSIEDALNVGLSDWDVC